MDCNEALSLISAAVDGELEEPNKGPFFDHLQSCDYCRKEYEDQKAVKNLLRSKLSKHKAPRSLVSAIKRQTSQELYQGADDLSATHAEQLLKDNPKCKKSGKLWKQKLSRLFFVEPYESKVNHFFALVLAGCVLAMLVFAGFVKKSNLSFAELQKQIIFNNNNQAKNLIDWTSSSLQSHDNATSKFSVSSNKTDKFVSQELLTHSNKIPLVSNFYISSIHSLNIYDISTVLITYLHQENSDYVIKVFVYRISDLNPDLIEPEILHSILESKCHVVNFSEKPDILFWKKENYIYSAITNHSDTNLESVFVE